MSDGSLRAFLLAGRCLIVLAILGFALVSVSAPLIPDIAFLQAAFAQDITLSIGSYGGCIGTSASQTTCPTARFGFYLNLADFPGRIASGDNPILAKLTYGFILFPITGALALLGLMVSIISQKRFYRYTAAVFFGLSILSGVAVTALSLYIFINARSSINTQFGGNTAVLGPALWLAVGSLAGLIFGILLTQGTRAKSQSKQDQEHVKVHISNPVLLSDDRSEYYQTSMTESRKNRFTFPKEPSFVETHHQQHPSTDGFYITPEYNRDTASYYPQEDMFPTSLQSSTASATPSRSQSTYSRTRRSRG